jgi:hypothetical protein
MGVAWCPLKHVQAYDGAQMAQMKPQEMGDRGPPDVQPPNLAVSRHGFTTTSATLMNSRLYWSTQVKLRCRACGLQPALQCNHFLSKRTRFQ